MYKFVVLSCVLLSVFVESRPKWQFLPPMPGYIPVYIRTGDTPLEEINPELAEAFHALPAGRSSGKHVEAEQPEEAPVDIPDPSNSFVDRRPYEKKVLEKKITKKVPATTDTKLANRR